ncbi:MAG: glycosyltransferase [Patescibacteria group bacterium]|nr:glycosyltransferase [Patescibacteria group bacterium]MCL5431596.1 glycosyltransferase [Patescibacteria group bacterium]
MRQENSISFVMPAYNSERTVNEAVESIINGNLIDGDEIIIVDDASTDKTTERIQTLAAKYPIIRIIRNRVNKGCPASRNIGIRAAKNLLIFNLDADDVLIAGSVSKLKEYLLFEKADVAAFGEIHFFKNNTNEVTHRWILPSGILTLADYLSGPYVPGGNYLYTKKSWAKVNGYWEYGKGLHEFWGFSLKQIASGSKFIVLANTFYYHRYNHKSLFIRETSSSDDSSLMATKMTKPFLSLIEPHDRQYIESEEGSRTWFTNLSNHPIRVKNKEIGRQGIKEVLEKKTRPFFGGWIGSKVERAHDYYRFAKDFVAFKSIQNDRFLVSWRDSRPRLGEDTPNTVFDPHYIYHTAWAARILSKIKPKYHTDISSILYFSSIISAFIPVRFYDYRPVNLRLNNLTSGFADLTKLPFADNSIPSLSCMHTVEHIGLGRYGDKLNPDEDLRAISELKRVLAYGGSLLFVVPIGRPRVLFNAHRIYSLNQVISYFPDLELKEFSLVPDDYDRLGMVDNPSEEFCNQQDYACGCFWFTKRELKTFGSRNSKKYSVDVVIPVYNGQDYIIQAIESVNKQTYKPNKIIVVDDGSTDKTPALIKRLRKSNQTLFYLRKRRGGPSSARNVGIKYSNAEFIAFLDADDVWESAKLEKQIKLFKNSDNQNLGVVYCNYADIDQDGNNLINFSSFPLDRTIRGNISRQLSSGNKVAGSDSAVLVKRECLERVGYFDENLQTCEDWDLWLRIAKYYQFDFVDKILVYLRRHPASLQKNKMKMLLGEVKFTNKRIEEGILNKKAIKRFRYRILREAVDSFPRHQAIDQILSELSPKTTAILFGNKSYVIKCLLMIMFDKAKTIIKR